MENATNVGCGGISNNTTADVTEKDGAVAGIILYDHSSNTDINSYILTTVDNVAVPRVALANRTLYKDGNWNTLCLPFDVVLSGSELDGTGVDVRTLDDASFSEGTLTLNFTDEGAVTKMEAGKPYIIKWEKSEGYTTDGNFDITSPVFTSVTVKSGTTDITTNWVDFCATYSPENIFESGTEKTKLNLGANNKLYYPDTEGFKVNACRAYFYLKNGLTAGEVSSPGEHSVRTFVLNFGDGETGIVSMDNGKWIMDKEAGAWHDLNGRQLSGKPTRKGVYINNGSKVVIK